MPIQHIAIIGGGLSGTLSAINLLQHSTAARVVLFEQHAQQLNRGAAYTENNVYQPLNVPIGKMSLYSSQPDHFYHWLQTNPTQKEACIYGSERAIYVPRKVFGDYLKEHFDNLLSQMPSRLVVSRSQVVALRPEGEKHLLKTQIGQELFDAVVLATGTVPPSQASFIPPQSTHLDLPIVHSWKGLPKVDTVKEVLIVGSGLSMVDAVIDLERQGFKGQIKVLSLHGLLPQPEVPESEVPFHLEPNPSVLHLYQSFRQMITQAAGQGSGWRAIINNLRPYTHKLWQGLDEAEKRRFMRHLQPYWEVHRHRVPAFSYELLQRLIGEERLEVLKGRITDLQLMEGDRVGVSYCPRHEKETCTFETNLIVNCTGPSADLAVSGDALLKQLIADGIAAQGPLNIGIAVGDNGQVLRADGVPHSALFAMASLRKGHLWESTALREIREQAEALPVALFSVLQKNTSVAPKPYLGA